MRITGGHNHSYLLIYRVNQFMEKVAVFVDVQNIYYTVRQCYNCHFNYNAFWAEATSGREIVKAIAYAVDRGDEKQRQFQNILKGIGFEVNRLFREMTAPPREIGLLGLHWIYWNMEGSQM